MNAYEEAFVRMCHKEASDVVGVLLNYIDINDMFEKHEYQTKLTIIQVSYDENLMRKILNQLKVRYILNLWDHCRFNVLISKKPDNCIYNRSLNVVNHIESNHLHKIDYIPTDYTLKHIVAGGDKGYWCDGRTHKSI